MFKHIYCVPTHRLIEEEFLNGFFMEVEFANKKYNANYPLIIFEDNISEVNKTAIYKMKQKFNEVNVYYITRQHVLEIYEKITDSLSEKNATIFRKIYPNNTVNYGNVLNRIFVFSLLFGADYISRRDSDVVVTVDVNGQKRYPIENEIDYLGKNINNKIIYVCGGSYTGKYSLDIESFICNNDYTNIKKIFSCMSIPEEFHDEIIQEDVLQNYKDGRDVVMPDAKNFPHCGNISLFELHKYFPCSPQDLAIGSDCFFYEVTGLSNLSLAYHSRAVLHKHTNDRKKEFSNIKRYWLGFLMFIDSEIFYRNFYKRYVIGKDFINSDLKSISKEMATNMKTFLDIWKEEFKEIRNKKHMDCVTLLKESNDNDIVCVARELEENPIFDELMTITEDSVREHAALIAIWGEVVDVCKRLTESTVVMNILKSSKI